MKFYGWNWRNLQIMKTSQPRTSLKEYNTGMA